MNRTALSVASVPRAAGADNNSRDVVRQLAHGSSIVSHRVWAWK
jgi:hypothetical protein